MSAGNTPYRPAPDGARLTVAVNGGIMVWLRHADGWRGAYDEPSYDDFALDALYWSEQDKAEAFKRAEHLQAVIDACRDVALSDKAGDDAGIYLKAAFANEVKDKAVAFRKGAEAMRHLCRNIEDLAQHQREEMDAFVVPEPTKEA